jgi:putative flippase GtrA
VTSLVRSLVCLDRRLLGWLAVGVCASLLELGVLRALHDGLDLALPVATALAAEMLIVLKFGVTDRWVFGHPWPTVQRALRYHGACAGALVVYWLVINLASAVLGVPYVLGFLIGTGAAFMWSLATNFLWVWAPRNSAETT